MNKEQRLPYLILTDITLPNGGTTIMCTFCKYAYWQGDCENAEVECKHRLWYVKEELQEKADSGSDCWGFIADISPEDAVDVVGYWLQGVEPDWQTIPKYKPPIIKRQHKQLKLLKV